MTSRTSPTGEWVITDTTRVHVEPCTAHRTEIVVELESDDGGFGVLRLPVVEALRLSALLVHASEATA